MYNQLFYALLAWYVVRRAIVVYKAHRVRREHVLRVALELVMTCPFCRMLATFQATMHSLAHSPWLQLQHQRTSGIRVLDILSGIGEHVSTVLVTDHLDPPYSAEKHSFVLWVMQHVIPLTNGLFCCQCYPQITLSHLESCLNSRSTLCLVDHATILIRFFIETQYTKRRSTRLWQLSPYSLEGRWCIPPQCTCSAKP